MHLIDDRLIFFATDLSNFLACQHLSLLSRRAALGGPQPPYLDDPALDVLRERGLAHEHQYVESLRERGLNIVEIVRPREGWSRAERWREVTSQTIHAMKSGADVIYQGGLFDGTWGGYPDFLLKVAKPSALGDWSYEVIDAKLAREAKGGALLQVLLYADLLEQVQGVAPDHVHVALGGPEQKDESFRVADYAAYFRSVKRRFLEFMEAHRELELANDRVEHCNICAWSTICDRERREADHLSLIAGISAAQRRALVERGITTLAAFAETQLPITPKLDGVTPAGLERIHGQALIQLQGRCEQKHKHELLVPVVENQGLASLPEPDAGDIFFDLEGDPYAHTYGIEYLFGYTDTDGNYTAKWALNPEDEKRAFEEFVDFVTARLEQYPGMHVYHYAPYETTAMKRLMGRHGTREDEIDRLLRGDIFVDLYRVVRQGLRASVESYSIKRLEPFYNYTRDVDLAVANHALATFTAFIELGAQQEDMAALLAEIQGYNCDDCVSTLRLRNWLEECRAQLAQSGVEVPRPVAPDPNPNEDLKERQEEVARVVAKLMEGVPTDPLPRTPEHARWLLAHLLEFHRREDKSYWWDYFRRLDLNDDEILDERTMLGGLELVSATKDPTPKSRSMIYRYRFPVQEHTIAVGDSTINPVNEKTTGTVVAIDDVACTIDLRRGKEGEHPAAIMVHEQVNDKPLRNSILRFGQAFAESKGELAGCGVDLLHARAPRVGQPADEPLVRAGETTLDAALRIVSALDHTVLAIQGPPGSGKTYTGARMILRALRDGKRVGITAPSHKVIGNLLEKVCEAATETNFSFKAIQKSDEDQKCGRSEIDGTGDNGVVLAALNSGAAQLAAGTAWLWSREEMAAAVDILFIDEAGQFSLANALAVAGAAKNLVLLGDPAQLDQPLKGTHPPGAEASALQHILGAAPTMPADRGLFLEKTWRLPANICAFTSEVFYDGRLAPHDETTAGAVRLMPVVHGGNQNESPEEVEAVAQLVESLLRKHALKDILIVTPYNLQVAQIARRLPGARVGTVDKFQGQEAAVAIYSMATSTAADAPRGMKFLYSPNRFNVATSRAKGISIVIASPELFVPDCKTPEQMKLANAFCRYAELAE